MPLRRKINTQLIKGSSFIAYDFIFGLEVMELYEENNEGYVADENDCLATRFEFISPAPFEHINRLGKYSFSTNPDLEDNSLRLLRKLKLNN